MFLNKTLNTWMKKRRIIDDDEEHLVEVVTNNIPELSQLSVPIRRIISCNNESTEYSNGQ